MGKTISQADRRRSGVILALLACLVIAGCAQRGADEEKRPGGFYGGVFGGM